MRSVVSHLVKAKRVGVGVRPAIDILLKNELTLIEGMPTANKTK